MTAILQEIREKIKVYLADPQAFSAILLILVALTAFGLGRQSVSEVAQEATVSTALEGKSGTKRANSEDITSTRPTSSTFYVASKNGEVYHLPHCSGAKRISEANKIIFKTKEEAEAAGLRPAANCKGI